MGKHTCFGHQHHTSCVLTPDKRDFWKLGFGPFLTPKSQFPRTGLIGTWLYNAEIAQFAMSYRHYDVWSKELPDGRVVEYHHATLFQANQNKKSWAGAKVSGVALDPIHDLATDLTRAQVEALFEPRLTGPVAGSI
jgi:hypothetical protein